MKRHMKVRWVHSFVEEPVLIYSEIENGVEVRKVECFRDGHLEFASHESSSGSAVLAEGLMPTVEEIAQDPEFEPQAISPEDFETVWAQASQT